MTGRFGLMSACRTRLTVTALVAVSMLAIAGLAGLGQPRVAPAERLVEQPVRLVPPLQPAESAAPALPKLSLIRHEKPATRTRLTSV
jgi:hypothetical protein